MMMMMMMMMKPMRSNILQKLSLGKYGIIGHNMNYTV